MSTRLRWLAASALVILFGAAATGPIRSYDSFWHLAAGRWIVEHQALPIHDPFAVASDPAPWINGEWLFEIGLYGFHSLAGDTGLSLARAAGIALLFALTFLVASRWADGWVALALTALAFAGGAQRLDVRPASGAALLLVFALALLTHTLHDLGEGSPRRHAVLAVAYAALTAIWINVHPSALIAPVIAAIAVAARILTMPRPANGAALRQGVPVVLLSAIALLANPYGLTGIVSPIELTAFIRSGAFVNAEWLPSPPLVFPLLYLTIAIAGGLSIVALRRERHELWRVVLLFFFAILAMRFVRNQGLWFAAFPILAAPLAPRAEGWRRTAAGALAVLLVVWTFIASDHTLGIDRTLFPVDAVARLKASALRGNVYNPDQFGGFLIWSFYPDRRVVTDGRNELYHQYIAEYAKARLDSRAWSALLRKYRVDLAVDEYHREKIDVVDATTGARRSLPASLIYFPRRQWALIAWDRAGMVFARRAAFPQEQIERIEIKDMVPDALIPSF
ncbi:MAG TPA: hypothetical protein VEZ11_09180 [Thermoanaerobaculia bacterium]|nr:hypothetical protein [Thermoanaerobaculia bacterium]